MPIPTRARAEAYLREASQMNPGPWVDHSRFVAEAAAAVAARHGGLDPERSYAHGLLHDIGRRNGVTQMRHILDGYRFLLAEGFPEAARISLTHSFPVQDPQAGAGGWDVTPEEYAFVAETLAGYAYDDEDRLFQLCDSLALPTGFCLLEQRFVDVVLRHGWNALTLDKWRATLELKRRFDAGVGASIYTLLPGVVETTFGAGLGA